MQALVFQLFAFLDFNRCWPARFLHKYRTIGWTICLAHSLLAVDTAYSSFSDGRRTCYYHVMVHSQFFFFLLHISNYCKHTRIYASPSPNCFLFLDWCCSGLHQAYSKQLMHFQISFIHYVSQRKSDMVCVFRLLHRFSFEHSDNIWVVIKLVIGRFVYVDLFRSSFLRWWRIGFWGWKSMRIYRNVCWFYTISTWAL